MATAESGLDRGGDRLPPLAQLRAFEALVRIGGVRSAARHLGLHHSVVSRHVTGLEAFLGVALLRWSQKRFTLTKEGELYYPRISAAMAELRMATRDVMQPEIARPLRIWCSTGLSTQWLAAQISDFEALQPQFPIELKPSDVLADLHVYEADVNIYLHLDDSQEDPARGGLKAYPLMRPEAMLAVSPQLARELSGLSSPGDLLERPLLHGRRTNEWRLWFTLQGVDTPAELPGELCWEPHMALESARLGRGILLANRIFFERDLARGDLVALDVPDARPGAIGTYLFVAREDRWTTPGMVALRNFIAGRMRGGR